MSKITTKALLKRDLTDIESKLLVGAGSSITVGAVVADSQHLFGYTPPLWLALLIVIAAFFVGGYVKGSTIPPVDTGNDGTAEQTASTIGADLAGGDPRAAADAALRAAGIFLTEPTQLPVTQAAAPQESVVLPTGPTSPSGISPVAASTAAPAAAPAAAPVTTPTAAQ